MSGSIGTTENLVMANGDGGGGGPDAPRPPSRPALHRLLIALVVGLAATIAVTVPLAYQAHAARSSTPPTARPTAPLVTMTPRTRPDPPPSVLPTTTINTTPALRWTTAPPDAEPADLDGATLRDRVVLSVDALDAVRVEFWIDPGRRLRRPVVVDDTPPFVLTNASTPTPDGFDTRRLTNGDHVIEVRIVRENGTSVRITGRFQVLND